MMNYGKKVKGTIIIGGYVRGFARVQQDNDHINDLKTGEILVTAIAKTDKIEMKCHPAGFVTSEPGQDCHTATIARELCVPCLTGVHLPDQWLRTGDLVELDATADVGTLSKLELRKGVRRISPTLWKYFSLKGQQGQHLAPALECLRIGLNTAKSVDHQTMIAADEYSTLVRELEGLSRDDQGYCDRVATRCYDACRELTKVSQLISDRIKELPELIGPRATILAQLFDAYESATLRTIPFRYAVLELDDIITRAAIRLLARDLAMPIIEAEVELPNLMPSPSASFEAKFRRAVASIAETWRKVSGSTPITTWLVEDHWAKNSVTRIVRDFAWLPTSYLTGHPLTVEEVVERITASAREDQESNATAARFDPRWRSLSKETKRVLSTMSRYVHLRSYRISVCYRADFAVRRMLQEIASCLEIAYDQLIYLTGDEISDGLRKNSVTVSLDELNARRELYDLYMANGVIWARTRPVSIASQMADKEEVRYSVQGKTAFPGDVIGTAVLVWSKNDLPKLTPEAVVISPMTTTDLTTAIGRNALAIVTDEGGMMSHAAVISRENRIVCVVGTQAATKVIHEGDRVRVAADPGVGTVHILERAGNIAGVE
jgi:phosphohistidine swiveling domain-containing protein